MKTVINSLLFLFTIAIASAQTNDKIGFGTNSPQSRVEIRGSDQSSSSSALNVTDSAHNSILYIRDDKHVGIGTNTPSRALSVGNSSQLQVDSAGNIRKVNNVYYSWPSSQGSANTVLQNNGSGTLTWSSTVPYSPKAFHTLSISSGLITWDVSTYPNGVVTLTGTDSIKITGYAAGGTYCLKINQDGTGSRTLKLSQITPSSYGVAGMKLGTNNLLLTTTASAWDFYTITYDDVDGYFIWTGGLNYTH